MAKNLQLEWAIENLEGAFEVLTVCVSLVEAGDPLDRRGYVRTYNTGTFSLLVELELNNSEFGTLKFRKHDESHPERKVNLEMINYPCYYCGARSLRVEPGLINYFQSQKLQQDQGVTVELIIVRDRGAIALPFKYGHW